MKISIAEVFSGLLVLCSLTISGCAAPTPPVVDLVYPPPPAEPRIKYITSYAIETQLKEQSGLDRFIEMMAGAESVWALLKPYGVTTDSDGRIYVTDSALQAVVVFDLKAKSMYIIGRGGPQGLLVPTGITWDGEWIYVTDSQRKMVFRIGKDGALIPFIWGGDLEKPSGIAVDRKRNKVYLANTMKSQIKVYDLDGKHLYDIGDEPSIDPRSELEESKGRFFLPTNLWVDKEGRLYVTETGNSRIQILDSSGKFIRRIGKVGDAPGSFAKPRGIAVDSEGNIYVVDAAFDSVQVFNLDGQLLTFFGGAGIGPGGMDLPAGIHIDENDVIYVVADTFTLPRVQLYQYMGEKYKARQKK